MNQSLYNEISDKKTWLGRIKAASWGLRKNIIYNILLYPYAALKFQRLSKNTSRNQQHIYTTFYRSPEQIDALLDPVLKYIYSNKERNESDRLQISVLAGSIGAEAYTLASVLLKNFPTLDFQIQCSDLHQHTTAKAQLAKYGIEEVEGFGIPSEFIKDTFDRVEDNYLIKSHIKEKVTFFEADIVNDKLAEKYQISDLIFLQNVLFHLEVSDVEKAINNALSIAKPHSAIFIDGMSLESRLKLTKRASLEPLDFRVKEIHEYARQHVPLDWWNYYYGVEPYLFFKRDRTRRYSTIFFRGQNKT